ncbi:MAG: YybH family protein [Rubripirellula sp.]
MNRRSLESPRRFATRRLAWVAVFLVMITGSTQLAVAQVSTPPRSSQADDERTIRSNIESYVKAFNSRNVNALVAFWSPEAVYTSRIDGTEFVGRDAIKEQFEFLFSMAENLKMDVSVDSVRFVSPNVAVEEGVAKFLNSDQEPEETSYSAVHVRRDGLWLIDRVTDNDAPEMLSNYDELKDLEWMIGSWVDEDESIRIDTVCNWTKNKNFITRAFTVSTDDGVDLSGIQIVGWDAVDDKIRSWTFDSDGGFATGVWSKQPSKSGKVSWHVRKKGKTSMGETTSAVNVISRNDDGTFSLQSVQRTLGNQILPNIDEVIVSQK